MKRQETQKPLAEARRPNVPAGPAHDQRNGFPCFSRGAAALEPAGWREIRHGLNLSGRELQIIQGIFDGRSESSIASHLGISFHTVRTHLARLRRKLKAVDRVSMILCVLEEFLRQTTSAETTLPSICRQRTAGRCPLQAGAA